MLVNPKMLVGDYSHCYTILMLIQLWVRYSCLMLTLFLALEVQARPVTYTGSAVMSGALNGISFTDAAASFSVTDDTINIYMNSSLSGPTRFSLDAATISFDIAGIGSGTITGPTPFLVTSTLSAPFSLGQPVVGFQSGPNYLLTTAISALYNLEILPRPLYTPRSFEGNAFASSATYETTIGSLYLDGSALSGTSTFIAAEPVPEPSTYMLLFFGLAAAFLCIRRRKTN
jgi:hypothetical protein